MKALKAFLLGVGIALIAFLGSILFANHTIAINVLGIIGAAFWIWSGICTGAFISGDRINENYFMDDSEGRQQRFTMGLLSFLIGLPNILLAVAIIVWFLK